MCNSSPPPTPDYTGAAVTQGNENLNAARRQGMLNNPNVVNPYGSQSVTWDGDTPTLTQRLSPGQQALLDARTGAQTNLANLAGTAAGNLNGIVGEQLDFSGAPAYGTALDPSKLSPMPQANEQMRKSVIDAMMKRADVGFGQQKEQSNSDLVARGLMPGTKGYEAEADRLARARNDYQLGAESTADSQVSSAFNRDMGLRTQGVSEQGQTFNQSDQARRQYLTELLSKRQVPLNELSALMSGSQVNSPFAMPGYSTGSVAPAPLFAANGQESAYNTDRYNANTSSNNALMNGLFSLGASYFGR
jgi:hypothetical protein